MRFINWSINLLVLFIIHIINCRNVLYEDKSSICSSRNSNYLCNPPFDNIIRTAKITVTNSCGVSKHEDDTCKYWKYSNYYANYQTSNNQYQCNNCNRRNRQQLYSLDNIRDSKNQTCWFSGRIHNKRNQNYVNITLNFNKRFEVYYLILKFCSNVPDNIEIYKSNDFGYSWTPWNYFSKDCKGTFNLPSSYQNTGQTLMCTSLNDIIKKSNSDKTQPVIPFVPTLPILTNDSGIDYLTVTNIRIKLSRFIKNSPIYYPISKYLNDQLNNTNSALSLLLKQNGRGLLDNDYVYYGISDLSVGGRCHCNGHSNACVIDDDDEDVRKTRDKEGMAKSKIKCVCHHHTSGDDCEKCSKGYNDKPWKRASRFSSHSCKRCHCNLHSRDCRFSKTVYNKNNQRSGGVCHKCLHNTSGRYCHKCQDGFHRDWSKPLSHENACIRCKCHGIGSKDPHVCDKKTGQCICKPGVTGKTCDRCKVGYRETRENLVPCKPRSGRRFPKSLPSGKPSYYDPNPMPNTESECKPCNEKRKRIRFKKFCRRSGVFMGTVLSKEVHDKMVRFEVKIKKIWRLTGKMNKFIVSPTSSSSSSSSSRYGATSTTTAIWLNHDDVRCNCPSVHLGYSYLMLTKSTSKLYLNRPELRLNDNGRSVVLRWRSNWSRRLGKFADKAQKGLCAKFKRKRTSRINRKRRRMLKKRYIKYLRRQYDGKQ